MLKTHMAACLLASALVAVPALAQTATTPPTDRPAATGSGSTTSGSPAMQPGGTAGSTGMSSGTAGSAGTSSGTSGGAGMSSGTAGTTAPSGTGMGSSSPPSGSAMGAPSGSAMGAGSAGSGMASAAGSAATMKPLAAPQPGQIMGSDLRGTRVYGANNESIGDISDLLLDRQGQVVAAIVGVGGFLGIGQKDVALAPAAFQVQPASDREELKLKLAMTRDELKNAPEFKAASTRPTPTTGQAPQRDRAPATPPAR
jgi:hypothetical protein